MAERSLRIKALGQVPYAETFAAMQAFTARRTGNTEDEPWTLEPPPTFGPSGVRVSAERNTSPQAR